jgi:cupin fold WbuC family metalloprotein
MPPLLGGVFADLARRGKPCAKFLFWHAMTTPLRLIEPRLIDDLIAQARLSPRRRQNLNLDPIQRFLNAGEPGSYVRPHRHREGRWELVSVLRGRIDALLFDETGVVTQRHALPAGGGIEIPGGTWHGFVFAESGSVALEVKPGPYDAALDKEFAAWAPVEADAAAAACARWLAAATAGTTWQHLKGGSP